MMDGFDNNSNEYTVGVEGQVIWKGLSTRLLKIDNSLMANNNNCCRQEKVPLSQ